MGRTVKALYLDFSKAFDRVSHSLLITTLVRSGLEKWMMRWMENQLTTRLMAWWSAVQRPGGGQLLCPTLLLG